MITLLLSLLTKLNANYYYYYYSSRGIATRNFTSDVVVSRSFVVLHP